MYQLLTEERQALHRQLKPNCEDPSISPLQGLSLPQVKFRPINFKMADAERILKTADLIIADLWKAERQKEDLSEYVMDRKSIEFLQARESKKRKSELQFQTFVERKERSQKAAAQLYQVLERMIPSILRRSQSQLTSRLTKLSAYNASCIAGSKKALKGKVISKKNCSALVGLCNNKWKPKPGKRIKLNRQLRDDLVAAEIVEIKDC